MFYSQHYDTKFTNIPFTIMDLPDEKREEYLSLSHEFLKKQMHVGIIDLAEYKTQVKQTAQELFEDSNSRIICARTPANLVGYLSLNVHPALHINGKECMIRELYVQPRFRRCGIGSKLLDAVDSLAMSENYTRISLATDWSNEVQSEFYRKNGFEKRCDFVTKYSK